MDSLYLSKLVVRYSLFNVIVVLNLQKASFATEPYFRMNTISGNSALSGSRPRRNAEAVQRVSEDLRYQFY